MTREEALAIKELKFNNNGRPVETEQTDATKLIINKIYDDIESRTCENCKFCDFDIENSQTFHKGYCTQLLHPIHLDFGCNRFKN